MRHSLLEHSTLVFLRKQPLNILIISAIFLYIYFSYSFKSISEENLSAGNLNFAQDSKALVKYLKDNYIMPPNEDNTFIPLPPGNWEGWTNKVAKRVATLLKNKTNGYFIECGANDGYFLSNTLSLETELNWTGLLIEGDPRPFKILKERQRKVTLCSSSLCLTDQPQKLKMFRHKTWEALSYVKSSVDLGRPQNEVDKDFEEFYSQCFPLYTVLLAAGVNVDVDYFSMDMEGVELDVLKTFPFDQIFIKVFSIEVRENGNEIKEFMNSKGYVLDSYIVEPYTHDQIFIHQSLL